eukprot:gene22338-biopygen7196
MQRRRRRQKNMEMKEMQRRRSRHVAGIAENAPGTKATHKMTVANAVGGIERERGQPREATQRIDNVVLPRGQFLTKLAGSAALRGSVVTAVTVVQIPHISFLCKIETRFSLPHHPDSKEDKMILSSQNPCAAGGRTDGAHAARPPLQATCEIAGFCRLDAGLLFRSTAHP